jgi:hypothetical protein
MKDIRIIVGDVTLDAELLDTDAASSIYDILPVETAFNSWGDEFYFEIPLSIPLDNTATTGVKVGDIGYWPTGNALAIFFGPTPMSTSEEPVPASDVNLVGRIKGDKAEISSLLRGAANADKIRMEQST